MLQFLIFIVHFMCLMELPIPTNLVDRSLLTRFHMEGLFHEGLFYYRTTLSMEICHSILSAFSARAT